MKARCLAATAAAAAGAGAALLGAAYGIYRAGFYHTAGPEQLDTEQWARTVPYGAQMRRDVAALTAAPCQTVRITAEDGIPLAARYYHHADGAPLAIVFHGYKGFARRDCVGGYTLCKKLGCNVLLPDQRAHGASGGHTITLGIKERLDCRAWARWAAGRFGAQTPIFLMGVSMGASTVLMAAGLDLPPSVRGILADCGYTSPRAVIRRYLPRFLPWLPVGPAYAVGRLGMRLFGRFDPESADCPGALAHAAVPVLLLHGEADSYVPCAMSRENYDACAAPKRLVTIPGAGHAMACYTDPAAYERAVADFLHACLAGAPGGVA